VLKPHKGVNGKSRGMGDGFAVPLCACERRGFRALRGSHPNCSISPVSGTNQLDAHDILGHLFALENEYRSKCKVTRALCKKLEQTLKMIEDVDQPRIPKSLFTKVLDETITKLFDITYPILE
jgi:hypothetical protein